MPRAVRAERPRGPEMAILKLLATLGADRTAVVLTSREIGTRTGVSQQAADRHLISLEGKGLVQRRLAARRQRLSVTPDGLALLRREYMSYRRIFEGPAGIRFEGTVQSGLGEGRYYLSQPGYVLQFSERLGYSPYPGTLNLGVPPEARTPLESVRSWEGIRIDGFSASGRTFGGARCYAARLAGHPCHAIVPERSHHHDVVEFIAPERLRDALHLADGDRVTAEIQEV